jgi:WD40 repeat protein
MLASASSDRTIRLLDVASGKEPRQLQAANPYGVYCVAFSPDGDAIRTRFGSEPDMLLVDAAFPVRTDVAALA